MRFSSVCLEKRHGLTRLVWHKTSSTVWWQKERKKEIKRHCSGFSFFFLFPPFKKLVQSGAVWLYATMSVKLHKGRSLCSFFVLLPRNLCRGTIPHPIGYCMLELAKVLAGGTTDLRHPSLWLRLVYAHIWVRGATVHKTHGLVWFDIWYDGSIFFQHKKEKYISFILKRMFNHVNPNNQSSL